MMVIVSLVLVEGGEYVLNLNDIVVSLFVFVFSLLWEILLGI